MLLWLVLSRKFLCARSGVLPLKYCIMVAVQILTRVFMPSLAVYLVTLSIGLQQYRQAHSSMWCLIFSQVLPIVSMPVGEGLTLGHSQAHAVSHTNRSSMLPHVAHDSLGCAVLSFRFFCCELLLCFGGQVMFLQDMPTKEWGEEEVSPLLSQAYILSTLFEGSPNHLGAAS